MAGLTLEVPADVRDALRVPVTEQEARLRRELAIRLYGKGLLPFGKARELAGLSKWAFHELLASEGIPRHYDLEELEADLATLEALE
ncbi:MAG: UPF0175 family protein [Deltaproteobacteria bacterium]|nr:UPF0175 family protein [Deltaproteobacteria bacterium]